MNDVDAYMPYGIKCIINKSLGGEHIPNVYCRLLGKIIAFCIARGDPEY